MRSVWRHIRTLCSTRRRPRDSMIAPLLERSLLLVSKFYCITPDLDSWGVSCDQSGLVLLLLLMFILMVQSKSKASPLIKVLKWMGIVWSHSSAILPWWILLWRKLPCLTPLLFHHDSGSFLSPSSLLLLYLSRSVCCCLCLFISFLLICVNYYDVFVFCLGHSLHFCRMSCWLFCELVSLLCLYMSSCFWNCFTLCENLSHSLFFDCVIYASWMLA